MFMHSSLGAEYVHCYNAFAELNINKRINTYLHCFPFHELSQCYEMASLSLLVTAKMQIFYVQVSNTENESPGHNVSDS